MVCHAGEDGTVGMGGIGAVCDLWWYSGRRAVISAHGHPRSSADHQGADPSSDPFP